MRTDERTDMRKLIVAFRNFGKAPKKATFALAGLAMKSYRAVEVQLHPFLILVVDGGKRLNSGPPRFIPTEYKAGWTPQSVRTFWRSEKSLSRTGNQTRIIQKVATLLYRLRYRGEPDLFLCN
jgi:hypothetical protein